MKSLTRRGYDAFERIAGKIGATSTINKEMPLNYNEKCKNGSEIYVLHPDHGHVILSPDGSSLGFVISSGLEERTNSRTKMPDFTHIGIHEKRTKKLLVYRSSKEELYDWEENVNIVEELETFIENQNAENSVAEADDEEEEY